MSALRRAPREYRWIASPMAPATQLPARLLSIAEGWAMVMRRGATPFVVRASEWEEADVCNGER